MPLLVVINLYSMADPGFRRDPWLMNYQWGRGSLTPSFGGTAGLLVSDRRYHRFYSFGQDQNRETDDDITPYP